MELYTECAGHGTPVLLIHGVLSDHTFFSGLAQNLSGSCKVISYDRRGYGESPFVSGMDYSLQAQADDACQVLQSFTDEPACVVGHSAGAHIALELAVRHRHAVRKLVLIEPSLAFNPEDARMLAQWRSELRGYAERRQFLKIFSSFQRATGAKRSEKPSPLRKQQPMQMERMRKNLQAFAYGDLQEMDAFAPDEVRLHNLDIPITVAVTQHNPDNIFWSTAVCDGAYFGWPVVSFPGTHSTIEENAEAFAKRVMEVLQL